jgi:N-acetylmuramoyl-L-alanine amidase
MLRSLALLSFVQISVGILPATPAAAISPAAVGSARARSSFVLAIDPGHGGSNLGAAGVADTVFEKRVTLELARRLRALLKDDSDISVVLCRDDDVLVPIRARARCVEQARAALFISLHANASPPGVAPGSRRGFELYVLSPQEVEDDAAVAQLRSASPAEAAWAGHEIRAAAEQAGVAAHLIETKMKEALGVQTSRGIRQTGAALDVLRGTGTPSVLIEVGFLDHPQEGAMLASPSGQDQIARALAKAVRELRVEFDRRRP